MKLPPQTLACEVIDYRQQPEGTPVEELVGHEVHRPTLVHTGAPVNSGRVTLPDNPVGFDGYIFIAEIDAYHVRHRWFVPELGRWVQGGPLGYADGINLHEYVTSRSVILSDSNGTYAYDPSDPDNESKYIYYPIIFKGYEKERCQERDRPLHELVADFNLNKSKYCGCIESTVGTIPNLTASLVKAWLIQESGGGRQIDLDVWAVDPAQVNVPGRDWDPEKEELGLREPRRRNEGTLRGNLRAALMALCRKGFGSSFKATAGRRENATFDGWKAALKRYNGRADKLPDGREYSQAYCECIAQRNESIDEHIPIELK